MRTKRIENGLYQGTDPGMTHLWIRRVDRGGFGGIRWELWLRPPGADGSIPLWGGSLTLRGAVAFGESLAGGIIAEIRGAIGEETISAIGAFGYETIAESRDHAGESKKAGMAFRVGGNLAGVSRIVVRRGGKPGTFDVRALRSGRTYVELVGEELGIYLEDLCETVERLTCVKFAAPGRASAEMVGKQL